MTHKLKNIYKIDGKTIVTAHRGFSGKYPENTLLAFEQALETGVDIIEFDVRGSLDNVPIILHDNTLDRTTDGVGRPEEMTLEELKKLNASFWDGPHDTGRRLEKPKTSNAEIPSLEEALALLAGKCFLNIQVYTQSATVSERICSLYDKYCLYERAFLMISTFEEAAQYKRINSEIEICVGEDRGNLERHKEFGSVFIQPSKNLATPEFCKEIKQKGLCANMFYANTAEDCKKYLKCGIKGIMTDNPDIILDAIKSFQQ